MSAAAQLAARTGRHSVVYGTGVTLTVVTGMASLAVFTRLMSPEEYGKLAALTALAGLVTLLSTIGLVQGILSAVFGATDDGDAGDPGLDDDDEAEPLGRKREALGTGLLLVTCTGGAASGIVFATSGWIAERLLGDAAAAGDVRLAGLVGGLGAVWGLLLAVPRLERRPGRYVRLEAARLVLALLTALPFVTSGGGARGVLLGLTIATGVVGAVALVLMRAAYRPALQPWVLPVIARKGSAFIPYSLSNWVMNYGGVLILTAGVSLAQLGFYRVALTLGNVIAYAASVFFMAWMPLKRTSLFAATREERGHGWIGGQLTTWFTVAMCGLYVVIVVGTTHLVRIAGPGYEQAGALLPVVGGAALAHAGMLLAYRVSAFPRKRLALAVLTTLAALLFVGSSLRLVDWLGTEGVPLAAVGSYSLVAVAFVVLGQRGSRAVDFEYGKLAATAAIAAACIAADRLLVASTGTAGIVADGLLVAAYPALLLACRIVTPRDLRALWRVTRASVRPARAQRPLLVEALHALPTDHRKTLYRAAGPRRDRAAESVAGEEVAVALRAFGSDDVVRPEGAHDRAVGRYLLSDLSRAERDAWARALWRDGVDPAELDLLEETLESLRRLPPAAWRAALRDGYAPSSRR